MTESPWTFAGESTGVGGGGAVTLVDGTTFMVSDPSGDLPGQGARGLFMVDTRVLSRWQLTVNDDRVEPLSVTPNGPFSASFVGRINDAHVVDAPLTVIQRRHVGRGMREDLEIRNHGADAIDVRLELRVGADFGGLFEVKAGHETGNERPVVDNGKGVIAIFDTSPNERHGIECTTITCSHPPDRVRESSLIWNFELGPAEQWNTCILVAITVNGKPLEPSYRCGQPVEEAIPISRLRDWRNHVTTVEADDPVFEFAVNKASEDLGALRIFNPEHPERVVVAAGAPWYMTLFGRDSLLTSWMALPLDQALASGVLLELAEAQGKTSNPTTEEQPGRILHEVRFDSLSARLLGGSNTYYGTVDATPLFVMLVGELARWTGITPTVLSLLPAVDRALSWIEDFGDIDGDGFVEYDRSGPEGLANQGWKDSWDGVRYSDGSVATSPIALCEVQGYVYAAYRARAELSRALSEPAEIGSDYDKRADDLRELFHDRFWMEEQGWYAIGLGMDKKQIGSLTSNIGHLLWTGIVPDEIAPRLAAHLVSPEMYTGWGVRTLSSRNRGYNPLSYHCGSVWPHDTALCIAGLARYGCDLEAQELAAGLLGVSRFSNGRLPELFAGFSKEDVGSPVPYPASCSPQAWAAASPLLIMRAFLGLEPNLLTGHLKLRPRLPPHMETLNLTHVPLGPHRVTIRVQHGAVAVTGLPDDVLLEIDKA